MSVHYAYLDESGNVGPRNPSEVFLVVALVSGNDAAVRSLARRVKRFRQREVRRRRAKMGDELKANEATEEQISSLLADIAAEDVAIVAVVVDKRALRRWPRDSEDIYRDAVGEAARLCAERWPQLHLTIDKRYTTPRLRDELDERIHAAVDGVPGSDVSPVHLDSRADPCLLAVDHVAWALKRKYEYGDARFCALLEGKVVCERVLGAKE